MTSIVKIMKPMILIVAYNAEKTIKQLLIRIPNDVWKTAKEIIVADDCSKDKTYQIALDYKKSIREIILEL